MSGSTRPAAGPGVALVDGRTLGATAAMLGDWDLQSTLLRRALQDGALRVRVASAGEPLLAENADQLAGFERGLIASSRGVRRDWASRYVLPLVEEFATERLLETPVRPQWLIWTALTLTVAAAFAFTRGWLWPALGLLIVATPLDLVAGRLATLRLRPLPPRLLSRRLLWPAAGLALLALGWRLTLTAAAGAQSSPLWSPRPSPKRRGSSKAMTKCRGRCGCFRGATRSSRWSRSRSPAPGHWASPGSPLRGRLIFHCPTLAPSDHTRLT